MSKTLEVDANPRINHHHFEGENCIQCGMSKSKYAATWWGCLNPDNLPEQRPRSPIMEFQQVLLTDGHDGPIEIVKRVPVETVLRHLADFLEKADPPVTVETEEGMNFGKAFVQMMIVAKPLGFDAHKE